MGTDDLHKKRQLERKRGQKTVAADRFLIVCEGEKTEPNYFRYFKEKIRLKHRDSIFIQVEGEGKNTVSLVEEAIRLKNRAIPDYSQVWCVFDKDSFLDSQFNEACQKANDHLIDLAYSIESFELWYILHFEYQQASLTRDQYIHKLKNYLGSYQKNDENMHEKILNAGGNQNQAIHFAKNLFKQTESKTYSQRNPSTTVFKLVEELNRFI